MNFILIAFLVLNSISCDKMNEPQLLTIVNQSLDKATIQSLNMARSLEKDSLLLPRSFENGKLITSDSHWWCSGFFPGVLWYLYENKPSEELMQYAIDYTERVKQEQYTTDNHDTGFIIYCSFGNGLRITGDNYYKDIHKNK